MTSATNRLLSKPVHLLFKLHASSEHKSEEFFLLFSPTLYVGKQSWVFKAHIYVWLGLQLLILYVFLLNC